MQWNAVHVDVAMPLIMLNNNITLEDYLYTISAMIIAARIENIYMLIC